jgi:hypothetical protein
MRKIEHISETPIKLTHFNHQRLMNMDDAISA